MKKLNLQQFAGGHSVTVYKDSHVTTATPSSDTDVQKNADVTLTLVFGTGYELDEIEVIAGGATIENDSGTWKVKMGASNATIFVKGKKNNLYKIVENCTVNVNGTQTNLVRNMMLQRGNNGAIVGVDATGTEVTLSTEMVSGLVKAGVLIKI